MISAMSFYEASNDSDDNKGEPEGPEGSDLPSQHPVVAPMSHMTSPESENGSSFTQGALGAEGSGGQEGNDNDNGHVDAGTGSDASIAMQDGLSRGELRIACCCTTVLLYYCSTVLL